MYSSVTLWALCSSFAIRLIAARTRARPNRSRRWYLVPHRFDHIRIEQLSQSFVRLSRDVNLCAVTLLSRAGDQSQFDRNGFDQPVNVATREALGVQQNALAASAFDAAVIHVPVSKTCRCDPAMDQPGNCLAGTGHVLMTEEPKATVLDGLKDAAFTIYTRGTFPNSRDWLCLDEGFENFVKVKQVITVLARLFELDSRSAAIVRPFQAGIAQHGSMKHLFLKGSELQGRGCG